MKKIACKGFALLENDPPTQRVKDEDGRERMLVKGYASTFDRVDRHGEIIGRDAWARVPADGKGVRFIHGHDHGGEAIGVFRRFEVTEKGLYFEGEILPTTLGKDLFIQIEAGALDTFSVGFNPRKTRKVKAADLRKSGVIVPETMPDETEILEYVDADLLEVSTVLFPANDGARVGVKMMRSKSEGVKKPSALAKRKDSAAVGSFVRWVYLDGEPGFGKVVEVIADQDVESEDGDNLEAIEGDPIYKIEVYDVESDGGEYEATGIYAYAYRSQVAPAEEPSTKPDGGDTVDDTIENNNNKAKASDPLSAFFQKVKV